MIFKTRGTSAITYETGRDKFERLEQIQNPKDIIISDFEGNERFLKQYLNDSIKTILIVNIAFDCEHTATKIKELKGIYETYKVYGLEILGFYCNQFNREKYEKEDILKLISEKYKISFPIISNVLVNGRDTHPLYLYLKMNCERLTLGNNSLKNIPWNFSIFLVDSELKVKGFFEPHIKMKEVIKELELYFELK